MRAAKSIIRFADALPYGFGVPEERTLLGVFVGRIDEITPRSKDIMLTGDFQLHLPNGDAFASKQASVSPDFMDYFWGDSHFGIRLYAAPQDRGTWVYDYERVTI